MRKKALTLLAFLLILCVTCSCGRPDNRPYEPDTPPPAAHEGVFLSEHGSMTFSGDGKSAVISFDPELAALTGLPEGEHEAAYEFLSGNLPPHGSIPVRYDTAHELRLTVGELSVVLELGVASEDGKTAQVGVDTVTPEEIPLLFSDGERFFDVKFKKEITGG